MADILMDYYLAQEGRGEETGSSVPISRRNLQWKFPWKIFIRHKQEQIQYGRYIDGLLSGPGRMRRGDWVVSSHKQT